MAAEEEQPLGQEQLDPQKLLEAQARMWGRQEFHEQLSPQEVRVEAMVTVDGAINSYYEDGIAPNQYFYEHSLYPSVRKRIERIDVAIPEGRVTPTDEEIRAGLVAGSHQIPVSIDRVVKMMTEDNIVPDPQQGVWRKNGQRIAGYRDDRGLVAILQGKSPSEVVPRNMYMVYEVSPEAAQDNRDRLKEEIERQFLQIRSHVKFLNVVSYQDLLSKDVGNYAERRFLQVGGQWMVSRYIGEMLNAPESRPGLMPRGDKLTEAFDAWRDIMEGRAVVKFQKEDGTSTEPMILPNPFAQKENWGLRQLCQDYVMKRIAQKREADIKNRNEHIYPLPKYLETVDNEENKTIARLAELLADHWDFDAAYGIDVWKYPTGESEWHMEGAYTDTAIKLYYPTIRMANERYGDNWFKVLEDSSKLPDRDHPRKTAVFTLKTLPQMSSHFLDVTMTDVVVTRPDGKREKQRVTLDQAAYGTRKPDGKREIITRGSKKYSILRKDGRSYEYEVVGLQNINWDDIQLLLIEKTGNEKLVTDSFSRKKAQLQPVEMLDGDQPKTKRQLAAEGIRQLEFAMGTNTNADKIIKALFEYYMYLGVYKEFTRSDYGAQYKEYTAGGKLKDLNKQISSAMVLPKIIHGLSKTTGEKLEEYCRISLCAGCVSNLVDQEGEKAKNSPNPDGQKQTDMKAPIDLKKHTTAMENAMLQTQFVRRRRTAPKVGVKENEPNFEWESDKDRELFHWLINNRHLGPQSPFDLDKNGMKYFTPNELEELKRAYHFLFE